MKRIIALMLVALMLLPVLAACGDTQTATTGGEGDYVIGIVTGTVSQGEEEFRAAENMVAKYGPDKIKHITYPDKFAQETETTVSQVSSLASDPNVKVIVFNQAVQGAAASIDKVKETRDDVLFILGSIHEDPDTVIPRADILMDVDQLTRAEAIIKRSAEMGAKTFIHYSFPRHMAIELLAARRDMFKQVAEEVGMEFVEVDAPDPTGDAGVPGAQQFIMEDVPRQVEKYGKDTAFFSTNCGMMEPLIKQTLATGAIFPEQCCPSPYHAYPGALGIEIPEDKAGDDAYVSEQIRQKIKEAGGEGRFSTWSAPANPTMIEAGVMYGMEFAEGKVGRKDVDRMEELLLESTGDPNMTFQLYKDSDNFILFTIGSQEF